jgi:hypothetical protein
LELLERRRMLSASTLPQITEPTINGGLELNVLASGTEHVKINSTEDGLSVRSRGITQIYEGAFTQIDLTARHGNNDLIIASNITTPAILQGGAGRDTLVAGGGATTLYAGTGRDSLIAGTAPDTLVAPDGAKDTLLGGAGLDSFWAKTGDVVGDVSPLETASGAVHWVAPAAPKPSGVSSLPEPRVSAYDVTYQNYAGNPLFGPEGPEPTDVVQGGVGDCYFLATLAAVAKVDPNQIRQDVVQLSDGSYLVRFDDNNNFVYEHVDAELPTYEGGQLVYAQLGAGNSMWVAVMEKAFAIFRDGADSYANLNSGWMSEVYSDLGLTSTNIWQTQFGSVDGLMTLLQNDLAANEAVTTAVLDVQPDAPLVADHAYTVDSVTVEDGVVTGVTLRNPWGTSGAVGYPSNNGYITITPAQAYANLFAVTAAAA